LNVASLDWRDLDKFRRAEFYRHSDSGNTVQFVGIASMPELGGEDVGVFRFVEGGRCLIATRQGPDRGETFTPIAEYQEPDEATTAEWRAFVEGDES
jgi:hypothetical protein